MTDRDSESTDASAPGPAVERSRRVIRDVRLVMILNLATIPLSLATNVVLGRTSAEVLGWYGAVQIFIAVFNTFLIIGGAPVFSRLVPSMHAEDRVPFLVTYGAMILGLLSVVTGAASLVPGAVRIWLGPFGATHWAMAYAVCVAVLVMAFATHFLYAVERAPQAAAALKSVIVGFFVAGIAGTTVARSVLLRDPAAFMWWSTLLIYLVAATLSVIWVLRTPEAAMRSRSSVYLPHGFWPVVLYTHVGTTVEFALTQLYPAMILVWLDVVALSRLHAALRFVSLLAMAPVMLTSVLAPGLARLEASGLREEALRQAGTAHRACLLLLAPGVFALVIFAPTAMSLFGADFTPYASVLRLVAPMALAGPVVYLGGGMAVAFGAFRGYLWVSSVFVATSIVLACVAIPRWGLVGAAAAGTVGSFVQQVAMSVVIRRKVGFRPPFLVSAAWIVAVACVVVATLLEPAPAVGLGLWVASTFAFAWLGSVTLGEIRSLTARALGAA